MEQCSEPLDSQAVGNALYGLKGHGSSPGTEGVLTALAAKIRDSQDRLEAQAVGNALYGLKEHGSSAATGQPKGSVEMPRRRFPPG